MTARADGFDATEDHAAKDALGEGADDEYVLTSRRAEVLLPVAALPAEVDGVRHFGPPAALAPLARAVRRARPTAPVWVAGRLRLTDRTLQFRPGSATVDAGRDIVLELQSIRSIDVGRGVPVGDLRITTVLTASGTDTLRSSTLQMRCLGAEAMAALVRSVANLS
ncbi:hypothetical protein [uncultured Amnibacterium sp.]|uniref:hypothetical protein n=1 Tax=uncultured Amnibacterium sp. TaxID=1631851 RepID=UPI0035CA317B